MHPVEVKSCGHRMWSLVVSICDVVSFLLPFKFHYNCNIVRTRQFISHALTLLVQPQTIISEQQINCFFVEPATITIKVAVKTHCLARALKNETAMDLSLINTKDTLVCVELAKVSHARNTPASMG